MSLFATILLRQPVVLPVGTVRKIGAHEAVCGNELKGKQIRQAIMELSEKHPKLTAKIAGLELGMADANALIQMHKLADMGELTRTVEKRLVFFTKPRRGEIDKAA